MRVTNTTLADQALAAMRDAYARLGQSQLRLATGRRIQSPADDPAGHATAVRLRARLSGIDQFRRQGEQARTTLVATSAVLDRLRSTLARAQEIAVTGADATRGPVERTALAAEVNQLLEEVVSAANTIDDGRHLLGGRETLTAPLVVTRNGTGDVTSAAWNPRGVDGSVDIAIAPAVTVQSNVGGTAVLGAASDPSFLPAVLVGLRDALAANSGDGARAGLDALRAAEARLGTVSATAGSRLRLVEQSGEDLDGRQATAESVLSAVLDADLARVASDLSQQELAYQAALHAAARAIQPSLLEFLR